MPSGKANEEAHAGEHLLSTYARTDDVADVESGSSFAVTPAESVDEEVSLHARKRSWRELLPFNARFGQGPARDRRAVWRIARYLVAVWAAGLVVLGFFCALNTLVHLSSAPYANDLQRIVAQWGKPGRPGDGLARWPTDFSRDILPLPCHSHNDYWRAVPLFSALEAGCTSVEADVWLADERLYVGHSVASLTWNRTFRALYVDPLVAVLEKQNPVTDFANATRQGAFDTDPEQSLVLLVDFKTPGAKTWPHVLDELAPLRERGWLTRFNGTHVVPGPVTVVGTGNTPFDLLSNYTSRDLFFDAPLEEMYEAEDAPSTVYNYTAENSFYASTRMASTLGHVALSGVLDESQLEILRGQVRGAHRRGLKVRYWDLPGWPTGARNRVWTTLVAEGVDVLNVDDLDGVKGLWG
ncbi:MAG: Altered inheritance of mitochondria protein 6 [Thelocarpon impressellum]|nr:MAG: Altered inheritance of mitochondria protein 6 [Thelocarpon impressellum]